MTEILKLYKSLGETPLECILRFKKDNPDYAETNMTYLGRLDPLAEGLLLVLAGDTRDKEKYLELDKTYEFEVLWGFETDSYDVLGLITATGPMPQKLDRKMEKLLQDIAERKVQSYPPFSSRTIGGIALHAWARAGKIDEINIPTRNIKIFNLEHLDTRLVHQRDVLIEVLDKIDLVKGDFRQEQIREGWKKAVDKREMALISKFRADVSSGTYIRSLAQEMGKKLDTSALAYSIKRTRVGEYKLDN